MSKIVSSLVMFSAIAFNCNQALAGAYVMDKGKFSTSEGGYYSLPIKTRFNGELTGGTDATFSQTNKADRLSQTSEVSYGLGAGWDITGKLDIGLIHNDFDVFVDNGTSSQKLNFNLNYVAVNPEINVKRELLKDNLGVVSLELGFLPGEFVFARNENYHKWQEGSYRVALFRAIAWQADLSPFDDKKRDHYVELEFAASHYYHLDRVEWEFNPVIGIRPAQNLLVSTQLYNTFNTVSFNKIPLDRNLINQRVDGVAFLDDAQKSELKTILLAQRQATSKANSNHKLDLKISYEFPNNRTLNLEGITEVFSSNSLKDSAIIMSYDILY